MERPSGEMEAWVKFGYWGRASGDVMDMINNLSEKERWLYSKIFLWGGKVVSEHFCFNTMKILLILLLKVSI